MNQDQINNYLIPPTHKQSNWPPVEGDHYTSTLWKVLISGHCLQNRVKPLIPCLRIYPLSHEHYVHRRFLFVWRVCVLCVFFPFILDIKFVECTSRGHTGGRSHRISHPPSFCGACLYFSREKDSAISFPRRPWSRILCTKDLIVFHLLGFFFLVRKSPVYRVSN